jgi:hypothetical protein
MHSRGINQFRRNGIRDALVNQQKNNLLAIGDFSYEINLATC